MKSIKSKITLLVICSILMSSLVIGGAGILHSKRAVNEDSSKIMNLICNEKAQGINALLSRIEQSVKTLTVFATNSVDSADRFKNDPQYVKDYTEKMKAVSINAAQNTEGAMTVYIRFNPEFTSPTSGLFYSKEARKSVFKEISPTDFSRFDPSDVEHVGWFYIPAQNRKATWMEPYMNENIGVQMISYVVPFYVDGVLIGVVGMDIDFDVLVASVKATSIYETGYAFLTDTNSFVVYHPDIPIKTDLKEMNNREFYDMAMELQKNSTNDKLFEYQYNGITKKLAFSSLTNGMRFVLTAPAKEIDARANNLILQISIFAAAIILLGILLTFVITRRLVRPLSELTVAAEKIAAGDMSISIKHHTKDEIGKLADSFEKTAAHLQEYIGYINELAYRDSLTGVRNKTAYLDVVKELEDKIRLKKPEFALIVFDVNNLKAVNDNYGHDFGDMMIVDSCKLICKTFRHSPVYRIGGDEFTCILENGDLKEYKKYLDQFEREVEEYNRQTSHDFQISIARGIAIYDFETDLTYQDVFKRADNAMYHNKMEMKQQLKKDE